MMPWVNMMCHTSVPQPAQKTPIQQRHAEAYNIRLKPKRSPILPAKKEVAVMNSGLVVPAAERYTEEASGQTFCA